MARRLLAAGAMTALLTLSMTGAHAQQAATPAPAPAPTLFKRTIVLPATDLSAKGYQVVQGLAEVQPGGESGWHTHPGEEIFHVLEGSFVLERKGLPSRTFQAGESFVVAMGTIHNAKNASGGVAKILATYVIEAGKPAVIPATP